MKPTKDTPKESTKPHLPKGPQLHAYADAPEPTPLNPQQQKIEDCYQQNKVRWNTLPPASPMAIKDAFVKALA